MWFNLWISFWCALGLVMLGGCVSSLEEHPPTAKALCQETLSPLWKKLEKMSFSKETEEEVIFLLTRLEYSSYEMWRNRFPRFEVENIASFRSHGERLHRLSAQALRWARKKEWNKVRKTLKEVKGACLDCHREYRFGGENGGL